MERKKTSKLKEKLTFKYRFVVLNEDTFEERFSFKLNRLPNGHGVWLCPEFGGRQPSHNDFTRLWPVAGDQADTSSDQWTAASHTANQPQSDDTLTRANSRSHVHFRRHMIDPKPFPY